MGNIFGKPKKVSRISEQDKAILELKKQRDQMKVYQNNILQQLEKERELAKKLLQEGRKDRAKLLLKKKRFQENLLERSEKQLDTIEEMCHSLEFAQIEVRAVDALRNGNISLKKIHSMLSIEEIEKIMDETHEGIEKQKEIEAILSDSLSPEDLEDVESELEKLLTEDGVKAPEAQKADMDISLPSVPDTSLEKEEPKAKVKNVEKVAILAS